MDEIEYEPVKRPPRGDTAGLADGITWLRMPLPFALNHINLWLLRDEGGWVIVDCGVHSETTRDIWHNTFAGAMQDEPATHVIATHLHPDHAGCAGWLVDRFGVDLWMTRSEYMLCRLLIADTGRPAPDEAVRFYHAAGFTEAELAQYRKNFGMFGRMVDALPAAYKRMRDGDVLHFAGYHWHVVTGGGHSPEHACLYDAERNILISGDMLLPAISANVSVWPTEPLANPLRDWFDALDRLRQAVPEDVLVLPSHGKPFRGAHGRLAQLRRLHEERLDKVLETCRKPHRVIDVFPALFNTRIDDDNRVMATGEAVAHLHYLCGTGDLVAEIDDDQVAWFRRT